ncbi:MAG: RNA methyltransferase [Saprospiraceae bacterium]
MISKFRIKYIKSLHLAKYRQIYNKFIAEGDKVVRDLLKNKKFEIDEIFICTGSEHIYTYLLHEPQLVVSTVTTKEMAQISALKNPGNILIVLNKTEDDVNLLQKNGINAIYLDGVQDPGNVGTIIRIADWFGINMVIRSEDSADFFNPKVVQSSMGSLGQLLLCTSDFEVLTNFGKNIIGTYMNGQPIHRSIIPDNTILVMGSEGQGISEHLTPYISEKISIGGAQNKSAESLNVAVAAGIICAYWKPHL